MRAPTLLTALLAGTLFGLGLSVATMVRPEVVLDFLLFRDFGLLLVLGGAVIVTLLAYQLGTRRMRRPLLEARFETHPATLNARILLGAAIFGLGWGICGVCPGPAIAGLGVGNWPLLWTLAGIAGGAYVQGRWFA